MKINVSGGGGGTFLVKNDKRDDLELSSNLTPYEAVHAVAEWLDVPVKADEHLAAGVSPDDAEGSRAPKKGSLRPKADT